MTEIKPVAWMCPVDEGDGPDISCNLEYASLFKGKAEPLYTADALAAAREEGRQAGLEEAIDALHTLYATLPMERPTIRQEVAAIRALKEKP